MKHKFHVWIIVVLLLSCNDAWLDKKVHLIDDISLSYFNGAGFVLTREGSGDLLTETINEIYLKDSVMYVKANPEKNGMDTSYYMIIHQEDKFNKIDPIRKTEYDSFRLGLKELIYEYYKKEK